MALSQDNLNFPLDTSLFLSFNTCLPSLKLIILIFSSIYKLHLPLNLFAVEDCLIFFPLTLEGGQSMIFKVSKIF